MTSDELVRRSLQLIDASQATLNAFRVVLTERRWPTPPRPIVAGQPATAPPCWVCRSRSRTTRRRRGADRVRHRKVSRGGHRGRRGGAPARAAGAVIVGKTNTSEFGQWPFTSGPGFGHTRNPWSREHTPGGSSGGSAAAVAAGLVAAAIGSDGAGSVRIPAAWTHLVGIKPQRGRISTWPLPEAFNGITVFGVLAHTVADAALCSTRRRATRRAICTSRAGEAVSTTSGVAPGPLQDRDVYRFPFTASRPGCTRRSRPALEPMGDQLRVARSQRRPVIPTTDLGCPELLPRSTAGLLDWAERSGDGVEWDPGPREHADRPAVFAARRCDRPGVHEATDSIASARSSIRGCRARADHRAASPRRARLRPTQRVGHRSRDDRCCPVTWPWNVLGWPSINVPGGFHPTGLPIGVQLMGPANSEPLLVSLAAELEALGGWAAKQPAVWWNTGTDTGTGTPPVSSGPALR